MNKIGAAIATMLTLAGAGYIAVTYEATSAACLRLAPEDRALLPDGACEALGAWFQTDETVEPTRTLDPYYGVSLRVSVNDLGAVPDDGIDDTAAIQAAIDKAHNAGRHGFITMAPGEYMVETVFPSQIHGTTLWGYGATWKRPAMAWFVAKYGNETAGLSAVTINAFPYHPRISYKWRGPGDSQPVRILGLTIDGNAEEQRSDYATHYSQQHAHLVQVGAPRETKGQAVFEMADVTLRAGVADGVALLTNVTARIDRIHCIGVFRGCVNYLGANDLVTLRDMYATDGGYPLAGRGIDAEPQGSSAGRDPVTYEDTESSTRLYWDMERVVLLGLDATLRPCPSETSLCGGWFRGRHVFSLTPVLNLLPYEGEMRFDESYFRAGFVSSWIARDDGDRRNFGESAGRWPRRLIFADSTIELTVPTDAELASAFTRNPDLKLLKVIAFGLDLSNASTIRDNLYVEFDNVAWAVEEPERQLDPRVQLWATYYDGNAAQNHRVVFRGGSVSSDFDVGLYQFHGGRLEVYGTLFQAPVTLCSYAQPAGKYAYTAEVIAAPAPGSVPATICGTSYQSSFHWGEQLELSGEATQ